MSMSKIEIDEARIDEVAERYYNDTMALVASALGKPIDVNDACIHKGLEAIARITEDAVCLDDVVTYPNPEAALRAVGEKYSDGIGCAVLDAVAQDLAASELLGEEPSPDTLAVREFAARVYDTILFDQKSVLIPWPKTYLTDDVGELHGETGPAVEWEGQREFFWHGHPIDACVIETPDAVTADYLKALPAEQRRASYEALGHERALRILGLHPVAAAEIGGLFYELYSSEEESWLRMQSPPLQDGSQPFYVEPVHEACRTCAEALAWRATGELGEEVEYEVQS